MDGGKVRYLPLFSWIECFSREKTMTQTSEWVSTGHPDKLADLIAAYILDRHLERDPNARVAVEVLVKDRKAVVAGEVSSETRFTEADYTRFVRDAINLCGYTVTYRDKWGAENTLCGDETEVTVMIGEQSPDIARGLGRGWGDQGIFWGMATGDATTAFLPRDLWLARSLGLAIAAAGIGGLDMKTQITMADGVATHAVAAVPLLEPPDTERVRRVVRRVVGEQAAVVVNGTGRFTRHGPIGDSGLTGRKLCVDFYGGNSRIGGGSPWGKDPSKADVTLNHYARRLAVQYLMDHGMGTVFCSISCAIGRPEIEIAFFDAKNRLVERRPESRPPAEIIDELGLREPNYAQMCRKGLFTWK